MKKSVFINGVTSRIRVMKLHREFLVVGNGKALEDYLKNTEVNEKCQMVII